MAEEPTYPRLDVVDVAAAYVSNVCPTCGVISSAWPPPGVAPCGSTYGTAAGPNDGKTVCGCGVVHPVDPRNIAGYVLADGSVVTKPQGNPKEPDRE